MLGLRSMGKKGLDAYFHNMTPIRNFILLMRRGMGLKAKDGQQPMPDIDGEQDWQQMMGFAKKQAVRGMIALGIRMMPEEQRPPRKIYMEALMLIEKIALINKKVDAACIKLAAMMDEAGLPCCILKGQGIALTYSDPTARIPGDIDVWVMAPPKQVIAFARKALPDAKACYHHVEYVKCDGIEVELHYRPAYLNNPIHNSRLQRWFLSEAAVQLEHRVELPNGAGAVSVPTNAFNRIFMMAHIMNHVIQEGIGMRQMMDYYYVLRTLAPADREPVMKTLKRLGMRRFTASVMASMWYNFGLEKDYFLCPPDMEHGKKLVNDSFAMGNFGVMDKRNRANEGETKWGRFLRKNRRVFSNLRYYPREVIWSPFARVSQFVWRKFKGYL